MNVTQINDSLGQTSETPIGRLFQTWRRDSDRVNSDETIPDAEGRKLMERIYTCVNLALEEHPVSAADVWRLAVMTLNGAPDCDNTFEGQFVRLAFSKIDSGFAAGPDRRSLSDCQQDASVLSGLLEGLYVMNGEGSAHDEPKAAVTIVALEKARKLARDLETLDG